MAELTREQVVDYLSSLPVIQIAELVKELEGKWGVSAAPQIVATQGGPSPVVETPEEQTEFDVILESAGESKMGVIKVVRVLVPALGLKEAKELVDNAPKTLLAAVGKEEANEAKAKLTEVGAKVILK